jgi:hypothetical protein
MQSDGCAGGQIDQAGFANPPLGLKFANNTGFPRPSQSARISMP